MPSVPESVTIERPKMNRKPVSRPASYEVAIVGAGAAGLAAAAVLGRCKRRVAVIGLQERGNSTAAEVHNLPFKEGAPPAELYAAMEEEVARHDIPVLTEAVTAVHADGDGGTVWVETAGRQLPASRLLLANGVSHEIPFWVPPGSWGDTVFDCPFCHAAEHDGEDFVIVGPGLTTVEFALLCAPQARSLTVVVTDPDAATSKAADQVRQHGGDVVVDSVRSAAVAASRRLRLTTEQGRTLDAGAVLLYGITRMATDLSAPLGLRANQFGVPEVDIDGHSSHPLVWVAGTAAKPYFVLAEAIGSGIRSAMAIHKDLTLTF
jgi:thioredoxin reductase (NADPH)